MKKILVILTAFLCIIVFASCGQTSEIPEGEYALFIDDKVDLLAEPLKESYKPGEVITIKTHTVCDATYKLTLNGEKAKNYELIHEENEWFYVWEFEMPAKHSLLEVQWYSGMDAYYYKLTVNDPDNMVINDFPTEIASGDIVELHTLSSDIYIEALPAIDVESCKTVKNSNGEILYYSWKFEMINSDLTIEISNKKQKFNKTDNYMIEENKQKSTEKSVLFCYLYVYLIIIVSLRTNSYMNI